MACMKHGSKLAKLLTDKGSCPWCYIEQVELERDNWEESSNNLQDEVADLKDTILDLEAELSSKEQEIMDGS